MPLPPILIQAPRQCLVLLVRVVMRVAEVCECVQCMREQCANVVLYNARTKVVRVNTLALLKAKLLRFVIRTGVE